MEDFMVFLVICNSTAFPIMLIIFRIKRSKVMSWYDKINERQRVIIRMLSVFVPALLPFLLYLEYTRE